MTVKELIEKLKTFDPDLPVAVDWRSYSVNLASVFQRTVYRYEDDEYRNDPAFLGRESDPVEVVRLTCCEPD